MTHSDWSSIQAIIFDMDGTLVDTERIWFEGEKVLLRNHNREYKHELSSPHLGLPTEEFISAIQKAYGLESIAQSDLIQEYYEWLEPRLASETVALPGVEPLITAVFSKGLPCAIATNSSRHIMELTLAKQDWARKITNRCAVDDVKSGKPDPDLYLFAAEQLNINPRNCLAIEDSLNGTKAAVAAGMVCFAKPQHDLSNEADFQAITPYIFNSIVEIHSFLRSKGVL